MVNNFEAVKCPECEEVLFYYKSDKDNRFVIKIKCQKCEKNINIKTKGGIFNE